jgi:hypothetical protein
VVWLVRTAWYADYLAKQGEIELVTLPDVLNVTEGRGDNGRPQVQAVHNLPDVDLMVFTRVLSERLVSVIRFIHKQGIKIVVDIDDDFRNMPSVSTAIGMISPTRNPRYNWTHTVAAAKEADWVTVSTPALQHYRPDASTVLRNTIPSFYLDIPIVCFEPKVVGWSGTVKSHPGDLNVTHGGVATAVSEADAKFVVIGDDDDVQQALGLAQPPLCTGRLGHPHYAQQLANFDVGIVPLLLNTYTKAKSYLTPLSMAALGVWWVGSPSPEYQRFYDELTDHLSPHLRPPAGLAAPRAREWRREVLRGLRTPYNERKEAVAAVRDYIREHHTVEIRAHERLELWTQVAHGKTPTQSGAP